MGRLARVLVLVAALLRGAGGGDVAPESCVDRRCFAVAAERADFSRAAAECVRGGARLLSAPLVPDVALLLRGLPGVFWTALTERDCPDCPGGPAGCVGLSAQPPRLRTAPCGDRVAGFVCELELEATCALDDGSALPHRPPGAVHVNATGDKFICDADGVWRKAPWSCEVSNGGCERDCVDARCVCGKGRAVARDGWSCVAAGGDPCDLADCEHVCVPDGRSFRCVCRRGFDLSADARSCAPVDLCSDPRLCPGRHALCVAKSAAPGFDCACKPGYERSGADCVDVDECWSGPCEQTCVNTDGGYRCECMPGYTLARDRGTCELHCPAAECPAVCDVNDDSQCECPHGFLLDVRPREKVCVDIDECDMFFCEQGCDNSYGGYACWCRAGYELVAEYRCVPGPDDDAADVTATPSAAPATERPPARSPGRAVAVAVCAAVAVLVVALIARHVVKRRRTRALAVDACVLSQVASDKHDMPSSGRRFKADN
ncbi:thrombomodulin [Denticeps clupeoides]|uniref:thrombomodulin n=1 Tax=Denticeps clupeoides TaxID=299321 RepID=UPI0010A41094|nr:thrombomodulin-like [Denticeps clupeoides]